MLGPGDLVLCAGTAPQVPLAPRAAAAAEAGFQGISVFVDDYRQARGAGLSDADLRRLLADHGLRVAEVDPLLRWIPERGLADNASAEGRGFFAYGPEDFFAVADALGARSINAAAATSEPVPEAALVEAFASLCERAAAHGLIVHLEFLPWTQVPDLVHAWRIVRASGAANGGVMLDSWHHFRSGAPELGDVPGERIVGLQLSDAPAAAEPDPVDETLHRRRLPGEGDLDLAGLLAALAEANSPAPVGVEVFSDRLASLPARQIAQRAADAARAVLERARR